MAPTESSHSIESVQAGFRWMTVPISSDELLSALAEAANQEASLVREMLVDVHGGDDDQIAALARLGILTEDEGYRIWAASLGLPFHALDERSLNPRMLHRLPADIAKRYMAVAVEELDGILCVVLSNPFDILAVDAIQEVTGMSVQVVMSTPTAIQGAISRLERGRTGIEGLIARIQKSEVDMATVDDADKLRQVVGDDAVVQLVDYLVDEALRMGASDVHVEPQRMSLRIRVRVDGGLDTIHSFPPGLHRAVVSRIKVVAGMDIGESRKPQDGRFIVSEGVEIRASVLPSVLGEKAVLRILDRQNVKLDPATIGMSDANLEQFRRGYQRPNGIVLLTGPTGSGKTTTLYAAMSELNAEDTNLITVEDPVEYELPGATQVQMNAKADRTFAKALKSILRQDPDVIMVGEIRDGETAAIAIQAALTGHMVLSTLHTNDAISSIHRLLDMGVASYLLGPALRCVVGQRLVPKVCEECAEPAVPPDAVLAEFGIDPATPPPGLRRGRGCDVCRDKGTRGRVALHEVLYVDSTLARLISARASDEEVQQAADGNGFRRMILDGLEKAQEGLVTLEAVLAVARAD